jgi:hypothetical protein
VSEPASLPGSTDDALYQVTCRTATSCLAVGTAHERTAAGGPVTSVPLAEAWNGRKWTASRPPIPAGAQGSELRDVSCAAAPVCMAVGSYANAAGQPVPLSERWTGRTWQIVSVPDAAHAKGGMLTGVSCSPTRSDLSHVSCRSATYCEAAGNNSIRALGEMWNGSTWRVQATPTS